jgi:iron complex outermembrane recepter protein
VTEQDKKWSDRVFEMTGKTIVFTTGPLSAISQRYANMNKTRVSGLDFELNHQANLGSYGKLTNRLRANYQLDYRRWDTVTDTFTENLVGTYANYRYNLRASTQWTKGPWSVGGTLSYVPSTKLIDDKYDEFYTEQGCADQGFEPQHCVLPKDAIVDANISYTGFKNLTISAYVDNLFNREMLVNPRMGDPDLRGRTLRLTAEYKF